MNMRHTGLLLLSLAAALASCSSDDDGDYKSPQTENGDGRMLRQLTISEVPITRATLTDNMSSLSAAWKAGDEATYFNVSSFSSTTMDDGTLTAASSNSTSAFQGTVRCMTGDKVALFYPAQAIPASGGVYVALFPHSPTGYMHFTVTNSSGTYTGTAKATLKAGKYYPVTLTLTKQNN